MTSFWSVYFEINKTFYYQFYNIAKFKVFMLLPHPVVKIPVCTS